MDSRGSIVNNNQGEVPSLIVEGRIVRFKDYYEMVWD
jgi:hypothetical protein